MSEDDKDKPEMPKEFPGGKMIRAGMQVAGGAIPFLGGLLGAAAGAWSEHEQNKVRKVFEQWLQMLEDEMREKARTIAEIAARVDLEDERIRERIESPEYQGLMKKAFRNWQNIDSESKRHKVRNILSNAAATDLASDDVIRLFLDWIDRYSNFHSTPLRGERALLGLRSAPLHAFSDMAGIVEKRTMGNLPRRSR